MTSFHSEKVEEESSGDENPDLITATVLLHLTLREGKECRNASSERPERE